MSALGGKRKDARGIGNETRHGIRAENEGIFMRVTINIFLLVCMITMNIFGQDEFYELSVINDSDGFVNLRKEPSSSSTIIRKITENDFFWSTNECKSDWCYIYTDNNFENGGFVYHNRIQLLSSLPQIESKLINNDTLIISNDTLSIEIVSCKFDPMKNKIERDKEMNPIIINGKDIYGTDGGMPQKYIKSIKMNYKGKQLDIPKSAYDDLYEPEFKRNYVYFNKNRIYIFMENSDGAGAYDAILEIKDMKYNRRFVTISPYI